MPKNDGAESNRIIFFAFLFDFLLQEDFLNSKLKSEFSTIRGIALFPTFFQKIPVFSK